MTPQAHTTWPELAIDLYDKPTGRGADSAAASATWKLKGVLKIRTRDLPKS